MMQGMHMRCVGPSLRNMKKLLKISQAVYDMKTQEHNTEEYKDTIRLYISLCYRNSQNFLLVLQYNIIMVNIWYTLIGMKSLVLLHENF